MVLNMLKKNLQFIFLFLILTGLITSPDSTADDDRDTVKKVLVIHSYHPEYEWVSNISRGIKRVFESEKDIHVETFYMDTQNVLSEDRIIQAGKKAREIISQWDPDILITVDDNAQEYVGRYYAGKDRPKLIFCGVSAPIESYGYPASNVTGILETSTLKDAVVFLDKRIASVKSISVLTDESPSAKYSLSYAKSEIEKMGKMVVSCDIAETLNQWKSKISSYQQNNSDAILIISYDFVKDEDNGRLVNSMELIGWTSLVSKIPIFGLRPDIVDKGALLGVITSGLEHGREAALIALGLLNGKSISDYPVKMAQGTVVMINKNTAQRLGIPMDMELLQSADVIVGD